MFNEEKQLLIICNHRLPNGKEKKDLIIQCLEKVNVDPTRRGETLSIEEFGRLADELYPHFH